MTQSRLLALPLNRPQYVPASEVLVSSLVWGLGKWRYQDDEVRGSRFLGRGEAKKGIRTTAPSSPEEISGFASHLRGGGLQTEASDKILVDAVVNGITGVTSKKAKAIPVSPMTTHLALSQSLRGVLGANNPPDIGGILESMFLMGTPRGEAVDTRQSPMAEMWVRAASLRVEGDPVLRAADAAMAQTLRLEGRSPEGGASRDSHTAWAQAFATSPFGWLHRNWQKLTTDEWVGALPPRVWTDWCTTLLRMGMAFGFLFENRWYEAVGRSALIESDVTEPALGMDTPLLPWAGSRLPVSSRNVKPEIRRIVGCGVLVRAVLSEHFGSDFAAVELTRALEECQRDHHLRDRVREAMSGRPWPGSCKNMYETILYSLQQRDAPSEIDYYGLLRRHGNRFSVIQPGTEWIAVVASLACDAPGGETNVGKVLSSLSDLGLRPELMEVVKALEAAGLAQGSADADHGVRVRSAY